MPRWQSVIDQHPDTVRNASPCFKENSDDRAIQLPVAENRPRGRRSSGRPHGNDSGICRPALGTSPTADARSRPSESNGATNKTPGIVIATSSSAKKGMVGIGSVARDTLFSETGKIVAYYSVIIGTREEQNPHTAELAAIVIALENLRPAFATGTSPSSPGTSQR